MKVIATRRNPNGSYDEFGTRNTAYFNEFRTISGAMRHGAVPFSKGVKTKIDFYHDSGKHFKTLYIN